jgi:hypothetical protein
VEKDCEANNEVNYQLINFSGHYNSLPYLFPRRKKTKGSSTPQKRILSNGNIRFLSTLIITTRVSIKSHYIN